MADLPSSIGRYEVVSRLGQGGMGSLYLAKDPKIGRLLAIKVVRQDFDSPDARLRFAREAQSAGTLRHQNIVTIFDVDEHESLPFIAMEYIDGETLAEIVRRGAPIPIAKRLQWIEDLCSGLAYAHRQGVIHRDIKPANLMVDAEGTLKILDFGLARRDESKFTQSHVIIGTPNYMSPEQFRGGDIDTRSDIFSVGAVLYEVLTYTPAFPGSVHQAMHKIMNESPPPIESLVPWLDPRVPRIIQRALEKRVDDRYRDLTAMKNELVEIRQRMQTAADENQVTVVAGPKRATPISGPGTTRAGVTGQSKRFGADRGSLVRRRAEQIEKKLDEARTRFEAGDLEKARDSCEDALVFDPDHPAALQVLAEIATETERRQVAEWLAEARLLLAKGQIDTATARVSDALALRPDAPDVIEMRDAIESARREMDKARQVQETLRRARAQVAEGAFESAIRIAGEALALDSNNQAAKDLQARAQEAIEARRKKTEVDQQAQSIVAEARTLFESGDQAGAIRKLESFPHKHDLVNAFLAGVKGEKVEAESEADPPIGLDVDPAHAGPSIPTRKNRLPMIGAAAAVVIVGVIATMMMTRGTTTPEPVNTSATAPAAPGPGVGPALPVTPPLKISPPAELTAQAPQNESDKDLLAAYQQLSSGQIDAATKIMTRIRQREPRHTGLRDLQAAIQTVQENEKQRAAAAAAAAEDERKRLAAAEDERKRLAAAAAAAPPSPPKAADLATVPGVTVLPGGGVAAASVPPSPALIAEVERPAIEAVIRAYEKALATKNLQSLSSIRIYTPAEATSWQRMFKTFEKYSIVAEILEPPVVTLVNGAASTATIKVREQVFTTQRGIEVRQMAREMNYRLEKVAGKWRLLPPG